MISSDIASMRQAHNLKVVGSNPTPATNFEGTELDAPGPSCVVRPSVSCSVYVLWSVSRKRFYIGVSENPERRLREHNSGVSRWTRGKGPWVKVWQRSFPSLSEARRFENLLKSQKAGHGFYRLTSLNRGNFVRSSS